MSDLTLIVVAVFVVIAMGVIVVDQISSATLDHCPTNKGVAKLTANATFSMICMLTAIIFGTIFALVMSDGEMAYVVCTMTTIPSGQLSDDICPFLQQLMREKSSVYDVVLYDAILDNRRALQNRVVVKVHIVIQHVQIDLAMMIAEVAVIIVDQIRPGVYNCAITEIDVINIRISVSFSVIVTHYDDRIRQSGLNSLTLFVPIHR
jgi:hypothetical protein